MTFDQTIQEFIQNIQLNIFHEYDKEQFDSHLLNYLEIARTLLIHDKEYQKSKLYLHIILEYSWEKLNTGIWQNVKDIYRYLYAYACYIDVLCDCKIMLQNDKSVDYQVNIIFKIDLYI